MTEHVADPANVLLACCAQLSQLELLPVLQRPGLTTQEAQRSEAGANRLTRHGYRCAVSFKGFSAISESISGKQCVGLRPTVIAFGPSPTVRCSLASLVKPLVSLLSGSTVTLKWPVAVSDGKPHIDAAVSVQVDVAVSAWNSARLNQSQVSLTPTCPKELMLW